MALFAATLVLSESNNPFIPTAAEYLNADGSLVAPMGGMNPLLMHWAMILHPPATFIGYAGATLPFAYALAALVCGDTSSRWVELSDRIAVFNKGFIEQIGTPNEVYNHSKTEFVCNFIGDINRLEGEVAAAMKLNPAQHHFVRLERIRVNRPADENELRLDGMIESREYYGLYIKYYIHVGSQTIKAIEKNDGINIYEPGEKVTVGIHPVDVMSYDAAPDAN